jgi:hypothetical protein
MVSDGRDCKAVVKKKRRRKVRPQDESQLTDQRRRYSVDKRDSLLLLRPIEG